MAEKVQYRAFQRNTLLEEIQCILHEYPDNEQIIKELLQNAEDAGARSVKMGPCPSCRSDHLPDPYKKYMSGPAFCFYNDSVFEEEDWQGITMVRKSNKHDDPLKVGKFGIGFKSVFHITDTVMVISGKTILFIDPLYEEIDPKKVCRFVSVSDFLDDVCGPQALDQFYGFFGIDEGRLKEGNLNGTLFWFPLRTKKSELSEVIYTTEKVTDVLESFKKEIGSEMLFLTSLENIELYKMVNGCWDIDSYVSIERSCAQNIREKRTEYKEKIKSIEKNMENDDQWITKCDPVWMKCIVTYNIEMNGIASRQEWLVINYFHAGKMDPEILTLIRNRLSKYRPYIGIAARLDHPIPSGQIFCFLPLPFEDDSPTGLPVHINGFFVLDSNRQHLKWPSHDQNLSKSHLENDMLWNVLMIQELLPIVYTELFETWQIFPSLMQQYVNTFYQCVPREANSKTLTSCVVQKINQYLLRSKIPCKESKRWVQMSDGYFAVFKDETCLEIQTTVTKLFSTCTNKVIRITGHEELFEQWNCQENLKETSPKETRNLLRSNHRGYKDLEDCYKEHLLLYCCSDANLAELRGIELLPLQSGKYKVFQPKAESEETVYMCEHNELEILIGKEENLVLKRTSDYGDLLSKLATSGFYAFQNLYSDICFEFLKEITKKEKGRPLLCNQRGTIYERKWLIKVWDYLGIQCRHSLDPVKDLFLIKTKESDELKKISDSFMSEDTLTVPNIKLLAHFKIWVVDMEFHNHPLLKPGKGYVQKNTDDGKNKLLQKCIHNGIDAFNDPQICSNSDREWFKEFLPCSFPKSLVSPLRSLKMFKSYSSVSPLKEKGYTSVEKCSKVYTGDMDFPVQFSSDMILPATPLLSQLTITMVDLTDSIQLTLKGIDNGSFPISDEQKRNFCFYVLERQGRLKNWNEIKSYMNKVKFIRNGSGPLYCAENLYDPNDHILRELFLNEFKFPEENHRMMSLLQFLKFQTSESLCFPKDLIDTCRNFECGRDTSIKERKSNALLQIFRQNQAIWNRVRNQICEFNIVPVKCNSTKNYPKSMQWFSQSKTFVSLKRLHSSQYEFIIGSTLPTSTNQWEELINTSKKPPLMDVIRHFENTVRCYQEDEHTAYCLMVKEIYKFLSEESCNIGSRLPRCCILTERGFVSTSEIYIERRKTDVNLEPHFLPLPKEFLEFKLLFENMGCNNNQSSLLLVEFLDKVQEKHMKSEHNCEEFEDLGRVEKILTKLSELPNEEFFKIQGRIKIPIQTEDTSKLVFKLAQECAFSDSDWLSRTFAEEDNVSLVHSRIDKKIASKLGVRSLKKFTLSDAEEICVEFGQSEPLTQRLNRLLEESYTDGLSVPKELIQNADDAGATKVYFLYDERENADACDCLLDEGMKGCQGPALWVYNDAVFTSQDFENIQKLSGATKKEDTTKIGKFGLGFNAVYNLTDVPSFVSGTSLMYLDPHGKYLGDAVLNEKSPGIKLNLKNGIMLRKLKSQFKPFEDVFDFHSSLFAEGKQYNGTLFRFPLRTKQQAYSSEISNREYSKKEMEKLMKQFCKCAGNLIIFTQNVKKVEVFHVSNDSENPDKDRNLVLSVLKEEKAIQSEENPQSNMLIAASIHCNKFEAEKRFVETCRSWITLSSPGHDWVERLDPFKEETCWVISWALGNGKARNLFLKKESDDALPLCSVGIPIETSSNQLYPMYLGTKKQVNEKFGFYDKGHIFCFLPLPIETPLAFHVNGTFAVSSDRQRLLTRSSDDKENTKQTIWNDSLLSDPVVEATLELLMVINDGAVETNSCYELWPTGCYYGLWKSFCHEFYKAVIERQLPVFNTHKGYKSFQECIFLHKDVRENTRLSQIAFNILKENPLKEKIITDIPLDVYKCMEKSPINFLEHLITYEQFIVKSFLPNIAKFQGDVFDEIVLEAMRLKNKCILAAIKQRDCIPSCKKNLRQNPGNLVHPNSSISGIFLKDDERFPAKIFCEERDLEILVHLGMMKDEIPFELLQLQSESVVKLATTCTECALYRSKEILGYIQYKVPKEKTISLSEIPFLPVKKKPTNWPPIKWYMESSLKKNKKCTNHQEEPNNVECFEKPCNIYFGKLINVVGCSKPVLERHDHEYFHETLKALGVKDERDIDVLTLNYQINEIIQTPENAKVEKVEEMCKNIYATIAKRLTDSDPNIKEFVSDHLSEMPCVLTEKTFVSPKQVIFNLLIDCNPYLFGLRSLNVERYRAFFEKVGVRQQFEPDDIINAILQIRNKFGEKQLSKEALNLVSRLTTLLDEEWTIQNEDCFLPDEKGYFCHVDELCINDFDWISTTESMRFLNSAIPTKVASLVGIKSKREQSLLNESHEFGDEFGQHEELTNRIKRILDGYPEACILKELLQNADDAGATVLHFIKDNRQHGTEHIFSDNWKELQGPALCVYNDSVFSEKDLKGIQNLGIGSKVEDPILTGQYGVGFNVVYHLTDVPTFLTRDSKNDLDILCVLDPHLKYIPCASSKKPGRKFTKASDTLRERYTDIMPCFLENSDIWKSSHGTLFRFPLRCNSESSLSERITSFKDLENLLFDLRKEIAECLLFLHNIQEVIISTVKLDGSLEKEFSVTTKRMKNSEVQENLHTFMCNAQEQIEKDKTYVCRMERKETKYQLQININNEFVEDWLIAAGFGFLNTDLIPLDIHKAYADKQLALLPSSGIAYNLNRKRLIHLKEKVISFPEQINQFKAYNCLPHPLDTGLPVHVNGHFALDYEARRNIWWSDTEQGDIKVRWNKCLIENAIVPTYVSLLCYLKTVLFPNIVSQKPWSQLDRFHKAFPCMFKIKDKVWKYTAKTLFEHISKSNCCVFPIVRREYDIVTNESEKENNSSTKLQNEPEKENVSSTKLQNEPEKEENSSTKLQNEPEKENDLSTKLQNEPEKENDSSTKHQNEAEKENDSSTKLVNEPEQENDSLTKLLSESKESQNSNFENVHLEIKWVPALSGKFPVYFDSVTCILKEDFWSQNHYSTYGLKHAEIRASATKQSEFITGVLKDLGMKIIESPMWIFYSMKDAKIDVQCVSPKDVLFFLKSYSSDELDSCKIAKINVPVSETRFHNVHGVNCIVKFCLKDKQLTAVDFLKVPLLLSEAKNLLQFEETNQIFITSVKNLLPRSANKLAHSSQFYLLRKKKVFESFIKFLDIEDFSGHVAENVSLNLCRGTVEAMNPVDLPQKTWITSFWRFLAENLTFLEDSSFLEDEARKKDNPLTVLCSTVLRHLGKCSFLPVYRNKTQELYPLEFGKRVFKLQKRGDRPEPLHVALQELQAPIFDERCFDFTKREERSVSDISSGLLASVADVFDVLHCLFFNISSLNLTQNACETVLGYFDGQLQRLKEDGSCVMKLKCLPFYSGLFGKFLTLKKKKIIVLPKEFPIEGLEEFGLRCEVTFIKANGVSLEFFGYLGCIIPTTAELYINHILPNFNNLPTTSILRHLMFIKNIVIQDLKYYPDDVKQQNLSRLDHLLKNIAFIPVNENRLAKACEFFNPHKDIFKIKNQLCKQSEIPPSPFDEEEWEEFLVHSGMISEMTPKIFADFANRLERLGSLHGLTQEVKANSCRMVNILFTDKALNENTDWFHMIQYVKFLIPHQISDIFYTLVPQVRKEKGLICFSDSTLPSNHLLVWTVMGIVSEDIAYMMRNIGWKAAKLLGFQEYPPLQYVLDHTRMLCLVLSKNFDEMCLKNKDTERAVTKVMTRIYEYLQRERDFTSVDFLKQVPFIYINDRALFVLPEQVVLDMNTHEEIPPYLCKMPMHFGQFYSLFKRHGAEEILTSGHLANVLCKIWKKSNGKTLEPNEMDSTKKAVKSLFSKLQTEKTSGLNFSNLYLPSKSKRLVLSSSLVFIDDKLLEKRINTSLPEMEYFAGFNELDIAVDDPISEMNRIPGKHLPQFLSKIVREQINPESKNMVVHSDFAKKLQTFLHTPDFGSGICRLVRDERYKNHSRLEEREEKEIMEKLQSVKVKCVGQLITIMVFNDETLPNTSESKSVFPAFEIEEKDLQVLCIYLAETTLLNDSLLKKDLKQISLSLNTYLGKPLKENIIHLPDVLACMHDSSEIENELDGAEISKLETKSILFTCAFMPELGSEIPIDLHHLLDNFCTYMTKGEYVAYEVYDPIIDDDEVCDTEPVYILAKILITKAREETNPSENEWTITYIIDIGSKNPIEVPASTVYKFLRSDIDEKSLDVVDNAVVFSWKTDRIKCYIRDVLRNAFRKSDREFKRTLKRLILQYHPDKHMDNKDYFNELYLFIIFVKSRLKNGKPVDDDAIFEFKRPECPPSDFDKTVVKRVIKTIEKENSYVSPGGHYFNHFRVKGPQPGQARRWLLQAEYDLNAATFDLNPSTACNWACFKCHQM
ncbi:sacsin-like isoform X3 [Crassostrea virginica]